MPRDPRPDDRSPARGPGHLDAGDWEQVLRRAVRSAKDDAVPLLAAGIAFWSFLSLFPALIAAVTVYGLVADPDQVERQLSALTQALPAGADELVSTQLRGVAEGSGSSLGWGLVLGLTAALFTASTAVQNMVKAVNRCYGQTESRGLLRVRLLALGLTAGALVFVAVAVGLIAVLPAVLSAVGLSGWALVGAQVARWALLVVSVATALTVLYRLAPARPAPRLRWLSLGSGVATALWIAGSAFFALYVGTFGSYGQTYGALAGVAVLLLWLFVSSLAVLVGAQVDAEAEKQAAGDAGATSDSAREPARSG